MKPIVYIATGNKSKLKNFKTIFSWINPNIIVKQVPTYIEVEEKGNNLTDICKLKVIPYIDKYKYPVIANDSGLYFDKSITEIQDPTKVKRNALGNRSENNLSHEKIGQLMFHFYKQLARKYGGQIDCQVKDAFSLLKPDGTIKRVKTARHYKLLDRDTTKYDFFHPLNSLLISEITNTFIYDFTEEEDEADKKALIQALTELIEE